jgi:1-acyl-sn-glycerol-3-phosphate acyltransferase
VPDITEPNRKLYYFLEPLVELLERYFDAEVRGLERIPDRAALLVGNHSGGVMTPDSFIFFRHYLRHTGFEDAPVSLAHDLLFDVPVVRDVLYGGGAVPASREHAVEALRAGRKLLVYPGGDWEAHRPSSDRDKIDFGGRHGFVKIALQAGVPIVPIVAAGAHDGWWVLTRGDRIACKLKLDKLLRLKVFPIALSAPFGLTIGPVSIHIPLPSRILIEVLEPMMLDGSADNPDDVDRGYRRVTQTMQRRLTQLAWRLRN